MVQKKLTAASLKSLLEWTPTIAIVIGLVIALVKQGEQGKTTSRDLKDTKSLLVQLINRHEDMPLHAGADTRLKVLERERRADAVRLEVLERAILSIEKHISEMDVHQTPDQKRAMFVELVHKVEVRILRLEHAITELTKKRAP